MHDIRRVGAVDGIERFLDSYWPNPFPDEILASRNDAALAAWLRRKHGDELIDRYDALCEEFTHRGDEMYNVMIEFAYETGLCEDVTPSYTLRGRETLRQLLRGLADRQVGRVADICCGDGRISVGLASYFSSVAGVLGIDQSEAGVNRMRFNAARAGVQDRVQVMRADVRGREAVQRVRDFAPGVVLAMYTPFETHEVLRLISRLLPSDAWAIAPFSVDVAEAGEDTQWRDSIVSSAYSELHHAAWHQRLSSSYVSSAEYAPGEIVVITELTK